MQAKPEKEKQKQKQKELFFYLKIHYNNKFKKFIVRNPKQISLIQIKKSFSPPISALNIKMTLVDKSSNQIPIKDSQELIAKLIEMKIQPGSEAHLYMVEEIISNRQQSSQNQQEVPVAVGKIRSRSSDMSVEYKTQAFYVNMNQLQATQQFLFQSLHLTDKKIEQAKNIVSQVQRKLKQFKQQSRQTNVEQLMRFLSSD